MSKIDIIYSPEKMKNDGVVMILGNFDGVHKAHRAVIEKGMDYAKRNGIKSGILMFENHTKNASLITPNHIKLDILKEINPDFVYIRSFDKELMQKTPEEFIKMLVGDFNIRAICVGYDYRFGHKASGDTDTLHQLGKKYNFDVLVTEAVKIDGETVSSTYIRSLLDEGNMERVKLFSGRDFSVSGEVEKGLQNGRRLGFPTANIKTEGNMKLPKSGVYAAFAYVGNKKYKSVVNVGNNPTFNAEKVTVEAHIINFDEDIYGQEITLEFIKRIRGDIKFGSLDELKSQIQKDVFEGMKILG